MLAGDTGEIDTSTFERQAVRMMIEEVLETDVSERLSQGYYERASVAGTPVQPAGIATGCASAG